MNSRCLVGIGLSVILLGATLRAHAQWLSETHSLSAGWNAVYLHVDASHETITNLIAADVNNPILEVWLWAPTPSTMQFIGTPLDPIDTGSQWVSWIRTSSGSSRLQRLVGNAAYLVRVDTNASTYDWIIKGKPVPFKYRWTSTGLNFLGFPVVPNSTATFESFLSQCPPLYQNAEIWQYVGGELGATNPARLYALRSTPVKRGEALWIRSGNFFNRYFAPFEATFASGGGVDFGQNQSVSSFRLRNLTSSNLTVNLQLVDSETPPAGQTNIAGVPPLLVRGSINLTNLTYDHANLTVDAPTAWTLAGQGQPGSEIEVVLGLNRAAITADPGVLLAGILRLTDSLGYSQIDVPVAAIAGSAAGLWVGDALVSQVGEYLKSYAHDESGNLHIDTNGAYVVTAVNTNQGSVARPFSLRLIIHNPAQETNAVLLQRVYYGMDANTNPVVTRLESALNPHLLTQARRISAAHLPWTDDNATWNFNERLGSAATLITTVTLAHDDQASNPFLHTYHPDHDNLDTRFESTVPQGSESYSVQREIRLILMPPANDFASLTSGGNTISGAYEETITLLGLARGGGTNDTRHFEVRGLFGLHRIFEISTLTVP